MNIFRAINNWFFPPRCIFCDRVLDFKAELNLCKKCTDTIRIPWGTRCSICFRETRGQFGTELCSNCRTKKPHFERLSAAYIYEGLTRNCVLRFKFHKRTDYAKTIGKLITALIGESNNTDMLIPVPISKKRFRERGYNQSELFTKEISNQLHIPMRTDLLFKIKDTAPQSSLKFTERAENIKGAYKAANNPDIKDKRIILTDDVATTRSTLSECAKILKKAGAKSVECITFSVVNEE